MPRTGRTRRLSGIISTTQEERINIYDLSIFVKEEGQEEDGLYRKYHETHYQRAYSIDEIMKAVEEGGLKLEAVYDAFTREKPKEDSQRIYVIAREQGKSREEEEKNEGLSDSGDRGERAGQGIWSNVQGADGNGEERP